MSSTGCARSAEQFEDIELDGIKARDIRRLARPDRDRQLQAVAEQRDTRECHADTEDDHFYPLGLAIRERRAKLQTALMQTLS